MFEQAQQLAGRLVKETANDPAVWVDRAWQLLVGRSPIDRKNAVARPDRIADPKQRLSEMPAARADSLSGMPPERAARPDQVLPDAFQPERVSFMSIESRRRFLANSGFGFGSLALSYLLDIREARRPREPSCSPTPLLPRAAAL